MERLWSAYGYLDGGSGTCTFLQTFSWDKADVSRMPNYFHSGKPFHTSATWTYYILQLVFAYNIILACWPLFRVKDDLSDIPLTPAQRKLLGLPPSSKPPTPGSQYITPPRYARTPTPLSGSPASKGTYSNSPISGSPGQGNRSESPFSPSASPLLHKAIGAAGLNGARRHSYGSASPLWPGASRMSGLEMPGTPSPTTTKGASVGLNNRWLYEKGRRNSGNPLLYA
jgi:nucleoporin POM34